MAGSWYIPPSRWKDSREDSKVGRGRKRGIKGKGSAGEDDDVAELMDKVCIPLQHVLRMRQERVPG